MQKPEKGKKYRNLEKRYKIQKPRKTARNTETR